MQKDAGRLAFRILAALPLGWASHAYGQDQSRHPALDFVTSTSPERRVDRVDRERLTVRRIDIVDSRGVIRMTLAGDMPNPIIDGVEYRRSTAIGGVMFRDDQGNERGGIGFGSTSRALVFAADHPTAEAVGFNVLEDGSTNFVMMARPEEVREPSLGGARLPALENPAGIRLSIDPEGVPRISINDRQDRARLRLTVTPEGYGAIEFLNAQGEVIETFAPERDNRDGSGD